MSTEPVNPGPDASPSPSSASGHPALPGQGPNGLGGRTQATTFDPRDLVPEPIFCCDAEGRFVWVNHAAEKLTGYSVPQLLGQPFTMLITPANKRRLSTYFIRQHLREAEESERDIPILTQNGTTVWAGVRVRRVRTLHGRVGYVACAHDLHDMVFEIERLRVTVRELKARVTEATTAVRLKSEFLSAMSTEVRSPMDGLLGMTQLLLESNLDRDQRTFAEVIQSSGQSLLTLVSDIIDFSRIEAGKMDVDVLPFDVRVSIDGTASMLAPGANAKGIQFSRNIHRDVPSHLVGDPGRLRQVLTHISRRLVHLMNQGEISIWTTLADETPSRVTLRFSIGCTGHDPNHGLEELFGVFETSDLAAGGSWSADALSVALSRQLIQLMGGEAGVERQRGGATLWFQIPYARQQERGPVAPLPELDLRGMRVLVADPSTGMRMALVEMLSSWGCVIEEAEDGERALGRIREAARRGEAYTVALIDMQLPGIDGETLARTVRAEPDLDGTLLMMLTNVGRRGDAARVQEWGCSAYLVKPFEPAHFYDALVEVIHRGPVPRAEAPAVATSIVTRHSVAENRRERLRILVVDDNPVNQLVAVAALRRAGYQPETASTASEAIQAHALHRFDLILMDLELPDLDGIEASAEIYRMEEGTGRRTPIVAVTGHDLPEIRDRCLRVGMLEMLTKPLELDALCAGVDRWTQPPPRTAEDVTPASSAATGAEVMTPVMSAADTLAAPDATSPVPSIEDPAGVPVGGWSSDAVPSLEARDANVGGPTGTALPAQNPPAAETPVTAGDFTPSVPVAPAVPEPATAVVLPLQLAAMIESDDEPVLDEGRLDASSMGNPELRNILIRTFVNHIRPRLARLRAVATAGDLEAVEFEAHGLKGMCGTIGAMACAGVFARVERLGRDRRSDPIGPMLDLAETQVARVEALMTQRARAA